MFSPICLRYLVGLRAEKYVFRDTGNKMWVWVTMYDKG